MRKLEDKRDARLPAGVTKIDVATGGPVRKGFPWCYSARVMVQGVRRRERFPAATPIGEITKWLDEQRGTIRQQQHSMTVLAKGTFESDVHNEYLPQVRHLGAYTERRLDIERWARVFKGRNR